MPRKIVTGEDSTHHDKALALTLEALEVSRRDAVPKGMEKTLEKPTLPKSPISSTKAASKRGGGKPGPAPKKPKDRESEVVALRLTPTEKQALKDRAGLVPLGTFLKHHIRTKTKLLTPPG